MGALFKAMAIANRAIAPPPGFEPDPRAILMSQAEHITLATLRRPGLRHAFFTRRGGRIGRGLRLAERRRRVGR